MKHKTENAEELKELARQIRILILKMTSKAGSGHPGGSMSATELLTALYFNTLNLDSDNLKDENRDRFLLSKGHCSPGLYAVLSKRGLFPEEELINSFRQTNSRFSGHVHRTTPGIEMSFGSLGQGLAIGSGMALSAKLDNKSFKTFVMLGDGEMQEGMIWESFMFAGFKKLNNLIAIIDRNKCQNDGYVAETLEIDPLDEKIKSFNWNVIEIDGHNFEEIFEAFEQASNSDKPFAIIANTIKGKGVSFMENDPQWHGKALDEEQLKKALKELGG